MTTMRAVPRIDRHERIYAIGDVHGRLDLLTTLVSRIRMDAEHRPARRTRLLFIGDVVDRGPQSREIVEWLRRHMRNSSDLIVLRGNHEQMMIHALAGDLQVFEAWLRFGGDETLRSWGMNDDDLALDPPERLTVAQRHVPPGIIDWLAALPLNYRSRDFFFVHAGIRPGTRLAQQKPDDLLWIREDFLSAEYEHEAVIVHGHSVREHGPEILRHRINLDTGAYRTGRLSAVAFEGGRSWSLSTSDIDPVATPNAEPDASL